MLSSRDTAMQAWLEDARAKSRKIMEADSTGRWLEIPRLGNDSKRTETMLIWAYLGNVCCGTVYSAVGQRHCLKRSHSKRYPCLRGAWR